MTKTFEELGLSAELKKALGEIGYETPFPIQEQAIPLILEGRDVIGQAHTGTGKTAAFGLPILARVKQDGPVQALVLTPTRELAVQVTNEISKLAKYTGIRVVAIYGGQSINLQHEKLRRGVQIVVATPGRLIDHIKQGSIVLDDVKFVVLDEADRMLDMGFIDDIKFILFYVSDRRQTCLFSATMPPEILRLADEYMKNMEHIRLNEEEITLESIDQSYLIVEEREKFKHLCDFIRQNKNEKAQTIVFAATKLRTDRVAHNLKQEGFSVVTIHGDLTQKQRDNSMHKFRKGLEDILVATDIAARGIDVPAVGHIINYDIPDDPLVYFHRIGRTARAGGAGKAVSLVSAERVGDFERILAQTTLPIRRLNDEMGIAVPVAQPRRPSYGGGYRRSSYGGGYGGGNSYGGSRGYGGNSYGGGGRRSYGGGGGRRGGYGGNRGYGGGRRGGSSRRSDGYY